MNGLNVLLTGACGRIGKTFFQASRERYRFTLTDRIEADFEVAAPHRFLRLDLTDPQANCLSSAKTGQTFTTNVLTPSKT